jgi:DNA-binding transcriptional MerR regulator
MGKHSIANKPEHLLSLAELGRALNVSQSTLESWKAQGVLHPDFVQGSTNLFRPERLEDYRPLVKRNQGGEQ